MLITDTINNSCILSIPAPNQLLPAIDLNEYYPFEEQT